MFPFFLYLIAGAVTGFHVYTLLMLTALGAPSDPLEFVSLLGSVGLVVAAYLSLFKPHAAARLALLASLAIWCFYGPAIAHAVEARFQRQRSELFLHRTFLTDQRMLEATVEKIDWQDRRALGIAVPELG